MPYLAVGDKAFVGDIPLPVGGLNPKQPIPQLDSYQVLQVTNNPDADVPSIVPSGNVGASAETKTANEDLKYTATIPEDCYLRSIQMTLQVVSGTFTQGSLKCNLNDVQFLRSSLTTEGGTEKIVFSARDIILKKGDTLKFYIDRTTVGCTYQMWFTVMTQIKKL
jgi:hypothetical protein